MMRWPISTTAVALGALLLLGTVLSLTSGAMALPARDSLLAIVDRLSGTGLSTLAAHQQVVIVELRLPRTLLAMLVGALLAQCGAAAQGLFRNPLADPGIIGVSSGAAVGAVIAIVWLVGPLGAWSIPLAAFGGGLTTTLLVYRLAHTPYGMSVTALLLAGVAIAALAGASIGLVTYFGSDSNLRDLSLWQMGSLAGAARSPLWLIATVTVLLGIAFQRRATALNALLLGEAEARHLGIDVEQLKLGLIVLIAVGVGVAVAAAGIIGFIGLVVPHLVRMATGPDHRALLPLSALCGALLLLAADLCARLALPPAELPVGLVTALAGAPFFIALLVRQRGVWQ